MPTSTPKELVALARLLEKEEPKLLVLVGTGVTSGTKAGTHASWIGLLKHGVRHLVDTQVFTETHGQELSASLEAAFSPFNLGAVLEHAELIEQNLKLPNRYAFAGWLRAAFSDLAAIESATLHALRDLQEAGALLVTTNYDSLLSEATGLPPVTWEERHRFVRLVDERAGILHLHGHWLRPDTVILGRSSYEKVAADEDFQFMLKRLWHEWSWLFVGCGNGMSDPNLGGILEWGRRWDKAMRPHYLLVRGEQEVAADARPTNLVVVGYPDHSGLPEILRSLLPLARCWPFSAVDDDFAIFRSPNAPANPFPSRQEYIDGKVPRLNADDEVQTRLDGHRWAFVLDVASVGKTTLALRLATAPQQRDHPSFYLDLGTIDSDEAETEATLAFRRLSRPDSLLVLDNAQLKPELARRLWDQWRDRPRGSKLLLIATRVHNTVTVTPAQDLGFFEQHATNPTLGVRPRSDDLWRIVEHLHARVGGTGAKSLATPPPEILKRWHHAFGSALGPFCLAVLAHLAEFQRGNWELPLEAASDWVREKWLRQLDEESRENLRCLAAFGAQGLELRVANESLPHPGRTERLLRLGLAVRVLFGQLGQYPKLSLPEPGWGRLILAAEGSTEDTEKIVFETAGRHPSMALALNARLRGERSIAQAERLWTHLATAPNRLVELLPELPLGYLTNLVLAATNGKQPALARQFWNAIEADPSRLNERALETPLNILGSFFEAAKRHGRDTKLLWEAIERDPSKLGQHVVESPMHFVGAFLDTAKRQGRDTARLWDSIEREGKRLAGTIWDTPLEHVVPFLDTGKRHGRDVTVFWEAIESDPERFAEYAWEASLESVTAILETAKRHDRNVGPLWDVLEHDLKKITELGWRTWLGVVAAFLDTAKRHERNVAPLWEAIEAEPTKFAEHARKTSLGSTATFLEMARRHERNVAPLWDALECEPTAIAELALGASFGSVGVFFDTAKRHRRRVDHLWEAIERDPAKVAESAWAAPLGYVAAFLAAAKRHGRDVGPLWKAIESNPAKLAKRVEEEPLADAAAFLAAAKQRGRRVAELWDAIERSPGLTERVSEMPLDHVAAFLETARSHGRNTARLWKAIEADPKKLIERVWDTPLEHLASFLDTAWHHKRSTTLLWEALEREPKKLIERAWDAPLEHLTWFLDVGQRQRRNVETLWKVIEEEPKKLAQRASVTLPGQLASFLDAAQRHGRDTRRLWGIVEPDPARFVQFALKTSLTLLTSFFEIVQRNGQSTAQLWDGVEQELDKFLDVVWAAPLHKISRFQSVAAGQGRDTTSLWNALAAKPEKLSHVVGAASTRQLAAFFRDAPLPVIKVALADLPANHWDETPPSVPLMSSTWIATRCKEVGRDNLGAALMLTLLRRASSHDFPASHGQSLGSIAWLLKNAPPEARGRMPEFLDAICTQQWLHRYYGEAPTGPLAQSLAVLGLSREREQCQRFYHPSLDRRLSVGLSQFDRMNRQEQSELVQLVGCAALCGWLARTEYMTRVQPGAVAALVVDTPRYKAQPASLEAWQFRLWLGLHSIVTTTGRPLAVPSPVIEKTQELLQSYIAGFSDADVIMHRVAGRLTRWLEGCSHANHVP